MEWGIGEWGNWEIGELGREEGEVAIDGFVGGVVERAAVGVGELGDEAGTALEQAGGGELVFAVEVGRDGQQLSLIHI
jgi:hypothetical protein